MVELIPIPEQESRSQPMRILLACEESQICCSHFRLLGHEAYSCDMMPTSGDHPEWHLQQDVIPLLKEDWDMIIAFPPCTFLTTTANRYYNIERYGQKAIQRYADRKLAIDFFMEFANCKCPKVAIENPVGVISSSWRKPDQIIHPWMFGDPFQKRTCLWLKGLPKLVPTDIVSKGEFIEWVNSDGKKKRMPKWISDASSSSQRSIIRSKTFPGIAKAMANQWGVL
jgi:hypothetical protein